MRAFELYEADLEFTADDQQKLKDRMDFIVRKMKENPAIVNSVFKQIRIVDEPMPKGRGKQEYEPHPDKINPSYYLDPKRTAPETDQTKASGAYLKRLVDSLMKAQGDADDIEEFLKNYGKVSYVDTNQILKTGRQPIEKIIKGHGKVSQQFVLDLYKLMFDEKAGTRGPGEVSLALLSPMITFPETGGDLLIGNTAVEVKGETSKGGGRLKDSKNSFGVPNIEPIYAQIPDLPEDLKVPSGAFTANVKPGKRKTGGMSINILDHAQRLEELQPGAGNAFMKEMMTKTYKYVPSGEYDRLFDDVKKMDRQSAFNAIARMSFLNYKQELLNKVDKGGESFNHIMFISPNECLVFELDKMEDFVSQFKFQSIDFADKINGPAVQTSLG